MPEHSQAKGQNSQAVVTQHSPSAGLELQGADFGVQQGMIPPGMGDPRAYTPDSVVYLQRAMGNRAVSTLLGRDRTENHTVDRAGATSHSNLPRQPAAAGEPEAASGRDGGSVSGDLEKRILANRHSGKPLPNHVRRTLEPKLGADLSAVKIHTDTQAVQLSRDLNAKAFTHKQHIYYGAGQSPNNMRLTAHEVVHTVQQGAPPAKSVAQRTAAPTIPSDARSSQTAASAPAIQRVITDPTTGGQTNNNNSNYAYSTNNASSHYAYITNNSRSNYTYITNNNSSNYTYSNNNNNSNYAYSNNNNNSNYAYRNNNNTSSFAHNNTNTNSSIRNDVSFFADNDDDSVSDSDDYERPEYDGPDNVEVDVGPTAPYTKKGEEAFLKQRANMTRPNRNKTGQRYLHHRVVGEAYKGEDIDSTEKVAEYVAEIVKVAGEGKTFPDVRTGMKQAYGWTDEDIDKYIDGDKLRKDVATKVEYLRRDDASREQYEVTGGNPLTQGKANFDTSQLFARKAGAGWANYVMGKDGRIYSASSKAGLFHHSSFMGGGATFGAGEWKVENGRLKEINNKSGHYTTGQDELTQTLHQLDARGVSLDGVKVFTVDTTNTDKLIEHKEDASLYLHHNARESILREKGTTPVSAAIDKLTPNKTGRQYPQDRTLDHSLAAYYKDEDKDSRNTVNTMIASIFTNGLYKNYRSSEEAVLQMLGWSRAEFGKIDPEALALAREEPENPPEDYFRADEKTHVMYANDEQERTQYEVTGGKPLRQQNKRYETNDKFAKFSGTGWAIYVMSPDGRFYSASSKVGVIHHSTFLGGGNVAGAGEWRVNAGNVTAINNKSGHYTPKVAHLVQTLLELKRRGVSLSGIQIPQLMVPKTEEDTTGVVEYNDTAATFVKDYRTIGQGPESVTPDIPNTNTPVAHDLDNVQGVEEPKRHHKRKRKPKKRSSKGVASTLPTINTVEDVAPVREQTSKAPSALEPLPDNQGSPKQVVSSRSQLGAEAIHKAKKPSSAPKWRASGGSENRGKKEEEKL